MGQTPGEIEQWRAAFAAAEREANSSTSSLWSSSNKDNDSRMLSSGRSLDESNRSRRRLESFLSKRQSLLSGAESTSAKLKPSDKNSAPSSVLSKRALEHQISVKWLDVTNGQRCEKEQLSEEIESLRRSARKPVDGVSRQTKIECTSSNSSRDMAPNNGSAKSHRQLGHRARREMGGPDTGRKLSFRTKAKKKQSHDNENSRQQEAANVSRSTAVGCQLGDGARKNTACHKIGMAKNVRVGHKSIKHLAFDKLEISPTDWDSQFLIGAGPIKANQHQRWDPPKNDWSKQFQVMPRAS